MCSSTTKRPQSFQCSSRSEEDRKNIEGSGEDAGRWREGSSKVGVKERIGKK